VAIGCADGVVEIVNTNALVPFVAGNAAYHLQPSDASASAARVMDWADRLPGAGRLKRRISPSSELSSSLAGPHRFGALGCVGRNRPDSSNTQHKERES
jgi:hypothetical protein